MNPSIHTAQVLPARAALFLGIVAFHGLLAYLFASGLIRTTICILLPEPPMDVIDVKKDAPPPEGPTPPTATPVTWTAKVVDTLPELPPINLDPDTGTITLPGEPALSGPVTVEPPAPPPIRLIGRNVMPSSEDYYPPSEIRAGHEGTAEVRSCVNESGRLDGTPTIEASSGRASLDSAAIRLARDGKYARAMRGDTPVPNCYRFRVTFTLH